MYNEWFLNFAPQTYRDERRKATDSVKDMLDRTNYLRSLNPDQLRTTPSILFALRMSTAPPIARDRLIGLAGVPSALVDSMESKGQLPPKMSVETADILLGKVSEMILRLADSDILPWLADGRDPSEQEVYRAATVIADRLCGANANPIVRNAQERRQLAKIKAWLESRGYSDMTTKTSLAALQPGTFAFRLNVLGLREDLETVNIPVDAVIMPHDTKPGDLPLMIEAKSAGDFTNTNKRRKEEAIKVGQLRRYYGDTVRYILFLCEVDPKIRTGG